MACQENRTRDGPYAGRDFLVINYAFLKNRQLTISWWVLIDTAEEQMEGYYKRWEEGKTAPGGKDRPYRIAWGRR